MFSGRGFARFVVPKSSSTKTKVELEFKTFWEDSRIFFVGNAEKVSNKLICLNHVTDMLPVI